MPRKTASRRLPSPRSLAIAVLVLALVLRLWDFNARSLWLDEAVEYWVAAAPLGDLFATVRNAIQDPPLYSLLLHVWLSLSHYEAWLRLLSLVFGMGSVLGVMVIAHRLQGWTSALAAGLLMAILPTAVHYSQEASQYAPMMCLLTWSVVALLALVREPGWRNFARWGLLAVASVYAYYGAVIPVTLTFACFLVESARAKDRRRVTRGLWTLAACGAAMLPLAIYFVPEQLRRGPTERAFTMEAGVTARVVLDHLGVFLERTFAFQFTGWPCTRVPGWLTVVVVLVLFALVMRRQRRMTAWFAVTWIVYAVIGLWNIFPFGFRYSLILIPLVVPLLACVAGSGTSGIRRVVANGTLAALGVICLVSLPNRTWYERIHGEELCMWPETEDVRQVAEYWRDRREDNQPTYVYYAAAPAFAYYADRFAREARPPRPAGWFMECWRGADTPACSAANVYYGRTIRALDSREKVASMFETMGGMPDQFWWIMSHSQVGETAALTKILHEQYEIADLIIARYATGALLRRRAP